jgi:hypothetical protein
VKWRPTTSWAAWWQAIAFPVLRDVAATGTGLYILIGQAQSPDPSSVLVTAGLILVAPIAAIHGYQVLTGPSSTPHGGQQSSEHASLPSSSPSSSPPGGSGEGPLRVRRAGGAVVRAGGVLDAVQRPLRARHPGGGGEGDSG